MTLSDFFRPTRTRIIAYVLGVPILFFILIRGVTFNSAGPANPGWYLVFRVVFFPMGLFPTQEIIGLFATAVFWYLVINAVTLFLRKH